MATIVPVGAALMLVGRLGVSVLDRLIIGTGVSGFYVFTANRSVFSLGVSVPAVISARETRTASNLTVFVRRNTPRSARSLFNLTSLGSVIGLGGSILGGLIFSLCVSGHIVIVGFGVSGFNIIVANGSVLGLGVRRLVIISTRETRVTTNFAVLVRGNTPRGARALFNGTSLGGVIGLS